MKEKAAKNAFEAFNTDKSRKKQFDRAADKKDEKDEHETELGLPSGEHIQPNLFRGTLKGYQLKGMNWLANLYDQVSSYFYRVK